ncbi:MAG: LUD domain-containing protein [Candidatus Doudnabacteria bacterium]|nr:LUD domain-containing protein [Candidatus Doudnabacteria bacterium]
MFNQVASKEIVAATKAALEKNGFKVLLAENGEEAKKMALELIPQQAEALTMTSITLETIGLAKELNESGNYNSARAKLNEMSADKTKAREMKRLGAAPEYVLGSVHAITEDGKLIIASNTGSQLGAYTYGADKVIFVAGTQKIVKDEQTAQDRIHEYIFPLESVRVRKAYGLPNTFNTYDSKVLKIQREITPERITVILVNEVLGF